MNQKNTLIKSYKVPRPLIYTIIENETYETDITYDHDIIIYNTGDVARDCQFSLFFYDVRLQAYREVYLSELKREIMGQAIIIYVDVISKNTIIQFLESVSFPERNISDSADFLKEYNCNNLIKYPIKDDRKFDVNIKEFNDGYSRRAYEFVTSHEDIFSDIECAITLDTSEKIQAFIDDVLQNSIKIGDIFSLFWFERYISRIYIGSQFCGLKLPDVNLIKKAILVCEKKNINVTINTSIITEDGSIFVKDLLEMLQKLEVNEEFRNNIEITINDFAVLRLIDIMNISIKYNLGILLNRRQKDPRYKYRWNYYNVRKLLIENEIGSKKFNTFYSQFKYWEYENNPLGNKLTEKKCVLHIPFYQTNTSRYCPMNAAFTRKDSTNQYNIKTCEHFCEKNIYLYSSTMPLVGVGNSNFGLYCDLDDMLLEIKNGYICRIVWDML